MPINLYNPLIARKSHRPCRSYHIPDLIIGMDFIGKVEEKKRLDWWYPAGRKLKRMQRQKGIHKCPNPPIPFSALTGFWSQLELPLVPMQEF